MINIRKKSDIVIPSEKVGDNGWIEKAERITQSLLLSWGTNLDICKFEPVSDEELSELETRIGVPLPNELRLIFKRFGVTNNIGKGLQEFDLIGRLTDTWDANIEPYYGPHFSEKESEILPHMITFGNYLENGNTFCFHDETKEIYYFDCETKPHFTKMFDCVSDYLKGCFITCQLDLFDEEVGQNKVRTWIEEIMIETFGEQTHQKWHY